MPGGSSRSSTSAKARLLGVYRELEDGAGPRAADREARRSAREIFVPAGLAGGAADGDLVALETAARGRASACRRRASSKRLGSVDSERAVSLIALAAHRHSPCLFARRARPKPRRRVRRRIGAPRGLARPAAGDDRSRPTPRTTTTPSTPRRTTIPAMPAASSSRSRSPTSPHYVRPGSALDRDALERGNSVYFPDRVVPMLPERISNDLCSLRPDEDRPALAVRMIVGADGRKRRHSFHRVMMRSAAKLSYEQAQRAIDGAPDETTAPLLDAGAEAALGGPCGDQDRARRARSARSRPARAQAHARQRRQAQGRALARAARRASADRGIHDPRQCRGGRDAGGRAIAADLSRPRRAERREDQRPRRVSRHAGRQVRQGRAHASRPFQRRARPRARRSPPRRWSTRWCCARRRRPNTPTRITAISASICAATRISPRRSAATPISSSIAR